MSKKVLGILAASTIGVSLVFAAPACLAKKKITWWVPTESAWKMMEERFEKQNPNVDVLMVHGDMDKFYTMITAGMMPDIWGPWSTPGIRADVNRNWAIDLGAYIKRDSKDLNIDDFFPGVMRQFKVAGKQYSLPIFSFADYYFYNKQLYAQAGLNPPTAKSNKQNWTWDKMVADAQKLTVRDSSGKAKQYGINFTRSAFDFPNYFHMWNAEPYSAETLKSSVPQSVEWNSPEMVNALTKMWELLWKTNVAGGDFIGGKVGATIENGWGIQAFMKSKRLQWAIAPLPYAKSNTGNLWPDGWRISKLCKDKELAWKFVKFLCSPENLKTIVSDPKSSKLGTPAVRKSVFNDTLGRDIGAATGMNPADVFRIHEQADDAGIVKYQETVCLHADLANYIQPELDRIWANKVDPKTGAANIQKIVDKALPTLFKRWLANIKFTGAGK